MDCIAEVLAASAKLWDQYFAHTWIEWKAAINAFEIIATGECSESLCADMFVPDTIRVEHEVGKSNFGEKPNIGIHDAPH